MKSIIIIIDYFGHWPEWFNLFLESCKYNPTVNWLIHTDCPVYDHVDNVKFVQISKADYIDRVAKTLGIDFKPNDNYKFNDLKPLFGRLYYDEIKDFDYFGYGDIDVIYGDLRKFYTEHLLNTCILVSTHSWCISGHLALFRNERWIRDAFQRIRNWKTYLENPYARRFDEDIYSRVFRYPLYLPARLRAVYDMIYSGSKKYRAKCHFVEQFSTPLTPTKWRDRTYVHPEKWFWEQGRLTNEKDGSIESMYLHFMNYQSGRFMNPVYGTTALWKSLSKVVHVDPDNITRFQIDRNGFNPF